MADASSVLDAVRHDFYALQNAPQSLRGDKSLILACVSIDYESFQFASEELRSDPCFVTEAAKVNIDQLRALVERRIVRGER